MGPQRSDAPSWRTASRLGRSSLPLTRRSSPSRPAMRRATTAPAVPAVPAAEDASRPGRSPSATRSRRGQLDAVITAHFEGLGQMEQYDTREAAEAFREVHDRAPGWIPGSINLAIALLNRRGDGSRGRRRTGRRRDAPPGNFDEALELLDEVLERDPDNLSRPLLPGHHPRIPGRARRGPRDFAGVTEIDPTTPTPGCRSAAPSPTPTTPAEPAGPKQAKELVEIYTKALERNPYLVSALYKLAGRLRLAGRPRQAEGAARDSGSSSTPSEQPRRAGRPAETSYGEMGRYATRHRPVPRPRGRRRARRPAPVRPAGADRRHACPRATAGPRRPTSGAARRARPGPRPLRRGGRHVRRRRRRQARPLPDRRGRRAEGRPRRPPAQQGRRQVRGRHARLRPPRRPGEPRRRRGRLRRRPQASTSS